MTPIGSCDRAFTGNSVAAAFPVYRTGVNPSRRLVLFMLPLVNESVLGGFSEYFSVVGSTYAICAWGIKITAGAVLRPVISIATRYGQHVSISVGL